MRSSLVKRPSTKPYLYRRPAVRNHRGFIVGPPIESEVQIMAVKDGWCMVRHVWERPAAPFVAHESELHPVES